MQLEDLEKIIKGRRSIRKWEKRDIPEELLKKAIELATWAPNGGNFQGWRFIVVKNRDVIDKMADAVQGVVDRMASWPEADPWREEIQRSQKSASNFRNAPACVAVFVGQYQSAADKVLIPRAAVDEEARKILGFRRSSPTAIQSAAAAVATLLLVLHQMGLGAVWMAAPLHAKEQIEAILKVPSTFSLVCIVAAGVPAESPQRDRKPVEEVLEFVR